MGKLKDHVRILEDWLSANFYIEMEEELKKRGYECKPKDGIPSYITNCPRGVEMEVYNMSLDRLQDRIETNQSLSKWNKETLRYRVKLKYFPKDKVEKQLLEDQACVAR